MQEYMKEFCLLTPKSHSFAHEHQLQLFLSFTFLSVFYPTYLFTFFYPHVMVSLQIHTFHYYRNLFRSIDHLKSPVLTKSDGGFVLYMTPPHCKGGYSYDKITNKT